MSSSRASMSGHVGDRRDQLAVAVEDRGVGAGATPARGVRPPCRRRTPRSPAAPRRRTRRRPPPTPVAPGRRGGRGRRRCCGRRRRGRSACARGCWSPARAARRSVRPRPCWCRRRPPPTASRADPDRGPPSDTHRIRTGGTHPPCQRRRPLSSHDPDPGSGRRSRAHVVRRIGARARRDAGTRLAAGSTLWLSLLLVTWWWVTGGGIGDLGGWATGLAVRRPHHRPGLCGAAPGPGRADGAGARCWRAPSARTSSPGSTASSASRRST